MRTNLFTFCPLGVWSTSTMFDTGDYGLFVSPLQTSEEWELR